MARAALYVGILFSFLIGVIASFPQLVCAEDNKGCAVVWTASQGELRFPDKNAGPAGLSLGREPGDENRIFFPHESVWGNVTPNTTIIVHGWEPERYHEVFSLLAGKRVSAQAKVRNCGSGESATSEILEISLVQLPERVAVYESPFNLRNITIGLAALAILSGSGHHQEALPTQEHTSPFSAPPPKEPY